MSFSFGEKFKITVFGQSHSEAVGVVIDGIPAGIKLSSEKIYSFMKRRAPYGKEYSTARKEADIPHIISGLSDGITCGSPLCAIIKNTDVTSDAYEKIRNIPRPSHSDFAAYFKYEGFNDVKGAGSFSGRMTAPLCFAGAAAMEILNKKGIFIGAHIEKIAGICDRRFDPVNTDKETLASVTGTDFPLINHSVKDGMLKKIAEAKAEGDSVGGVIECAVTGLSVGIGEPLFDSIESAVSHVVFSVPAIKGIEFGNGFASADLKGSENNDEFILRDNQIKTETNNHGGILGGLSSSMPLIFRVAVKPTPSIMKAQKSVDMKTMKETEISAIGRHDPCIVPRAVPCIEAAAAVALINLI